jgi:glycosyltransferase involved in cell wall biosynthesis
MRFTRRISDSYDVIIGVHNEMDYGRRGIQYVHYPTYFRPRPKVDLRWYHRFTPALEGYYRLADAIADFSNERLRQNLTLTNSNWTAERIKEVHGIAARTLYPPVVESDVARPWEERETAFLAVGRIAHEKEWERCMRILARVHDHVPGLRLTIVGTWDRHARRYMRSLEELAASLGSWIEFRQDLRREEVRDLMASHRYGIHGMREEHFGMAPAEMVRAGMIVWVPRGGGQMEIVGDEPLLLYDEEAEAAEKIVRVLGDDASQRRLREHLEARSALFGTNRFENEVRAIVAEFHE